MINLLLTLNNKFHSVKVLNGNNEIQFQENNCTKRDCRRM